MIEADSGLGPPRPGAHGLLATLLKTIFGFYTWASQSIFAPLYWSLIVCFYALVATHILANFNAHISDALIRWCDVPVVSLLCKASEYPNIPVFATVPAKTIYRAAFPSLMDMEAAAFEQLLGDSAAASGLSLQIKKAQLSASAVSAIVQGSGLPKEQYIVALLEDIVSNAKDTSRSLQYYDKKIASAVDRYVPRVFRLCNELKAFPASLHITNTFSPT